MPVIKSTDNQCSVKTIKYVSFEGNQPHLTSLTDDANEETTEIQRQIDRIISEAEDKAKDIIQKAHIEAESIQEKAYQSGYEVGQEIAIKETQAAMDSISKTFIKGLEDIASLKDSILSQAEDDMVQLTIAIANKLVCRELQQHPDAIIAVAKKAIKAARNGKEITIKVNPEDHTILKQHMSELMEHIGKTSELRIEEDPDQSPGGCIVETDANLIDMSFETRMESIFEGIDQDTKEWQ